MGRHYRRRAPSRAVRAMIVAPPMEHPEPEPPSARGTVSGLSYALFEPVGEALGGVVILHGAGSRKESHYDFARAARAAGIAAVAFDQRGHGASEGALDGRALDDVLSVAGVLPAGKPLALRGSSMGGCFALLAAGPLRANAVVAICPADPKLMARGVRAGVFPGPAANFRVQRDELDELLGNADLQDAVSQLNASLLLMHAEGDESVPVERSRTLFEVATTPHKRLIVAPGGHHRSIQHDAELQGESIRFLVEAFSRGRVRAR